MNDSHTESNTPGLNEDRSTRELVIRSAMREFARHGFRGASIRGIATEAGVSAGLVQHHFGTKDGLRQACDAQVMHIFRDAMLHMVQRGAPPLDDEMAARLDALQPIIDYLMMSLTSESESAGYWFKQIAEYTHEVLTSERIGPALDPETQDTWAIAATQTAMALGVTAFYRRIQETLGEDDETALMSRVGLARLFLAPDRILGQDTRERMAQMLGQYGDSKTTGKPPPSHEPTNGNDAENGDG